MRRRALLFCVFLAAAAVAAAAWLASRPRPAAPAVAQVVGHTMGGDWSVRFGVPLDPAAAKKHEAAVQALLNRIDGQMSTWKPDSDLSRFNAHRGTDWFPAPADVAACVAEARRVSEDTGGAFDATVGPAVNLWGFGPTTQPAADPAARIPPDAAVAAALAHVGYQKLEARRDPPALRKSDPDVYVDLGGVAQGYAADRVAELLESAGVTAYLVDVCGEARTRGQSNRGGPWRVGIQAPVPDTRQGVRGVKLADVALATSGDYQNFFDVNGKRYSHEIDPRTGRPADNGLASVTVAHPSAATADALATALMVLGPDAALKFAADRKLAVLLIVRVSQGFETRSTPAFEPLLIPQPATGPATAP